MDRLFHFFSGYKIIKIEKADAVEFFNLCREYGVYYSDFEECCGECGEHYKIRLSLTSAKKLLKLCKIKSIDAEVERIGGLPHLLFRYRRRAGLFAGGILGIAFAIVTSFMVWDIRVEGNHRMSKSEVLDILAECGFEVGCFYRGLDTDVIENRVLILSDDISWITINVRGTVAEVEIREREIIDDTEYMTAANLVAEHEGVIEYFEDTRGRVTVEIGEAVSEGDLLVGGIYGTEEEGFRYTVARGKVFARTEREFCVEIPLEYEKKVYTGRVFTEKYLIFFKKEVKFYGNSGNLYASCDTIDIVEYFPALEGASLPFGIRTVRYLEYEYRTEQRSVAEATELAYYTLRCKMEREIPDAELLSKQIGFFVGDSFYRLECKVRVIENIAAVKEIAVTLP